MLKLYKYQKKVFTNKEIAIIWQENNPDNLKSKIAYYVKVGKLIPLTRGVFSKDKDYNPRELAASIYTPSYISFETVLRDAGIIFQHYDTIFVAGPYSLGKKIDTHSISFRKLKSSVLYNALGVRYEKNHSIATPERAFLDMIYLFPDYYFDNLRFVDWEKCFELVKIYDNKQLIKRLAKYKKDYAE